MFKLKPGNVFQKINTMDRKQAYTWGAIVVVVFVALLTLASSMGDADDASFDGLDSRGYDLAQMPFVNDEAEQYLLASKYPDMQDNNATVLFSAEEKAARQEEDAANEEAVANSSQEEDEDTYSSSYNRRSSRDDNYSYGSRRGGQGRREPTPIGQLNSASIGHANGGGVSSTFGAPRGDFSTYKNQDKGKETPSQLKGQNARQALYQYAKNSQAAARLKEGKGANAKRALLAGKIQGSDAFTKDGVDLDKLKRAGLTLDTNAPITSADYDSLAQDVSDAVSNAEKKDQKEEETFWDRLKDEMLSLATDVAKQGLSRLVSNGVDEMFDRRDANRAGQKYAAEYLSGCTTNDSGCVTLAKNILGENSSDYAKWINGNGSLGSYISPRRAGRYLRQTGNKEYMQKYYEGWGSGSDNRLDIGMDCSNVTCPGNKKPTASGGKCVC